MLEKTPIKIFSGAGTEYLSNKIVKFYKTSLGKKSILRFGDGEFQPCFEETVRNNFVFLIQSTFQPTENLFELLLMIDAAKRASAYKIIAVIPYFGFARQDRKDKPRVPIGAKLIANLLSAAGVSRIITMDLHADQIQGFFDIPVDHLYASVVFIPHIKKYLNMENLAFASPDMGGTKRANAYAKYFRANVVISHKRREKANEVASIKIIGNVKGKNIIIIDDLIDTAGTICKAAEVVMNKGANSVRVMATHAVLSNPAYERIENSVLKEVFVTDTIPLKKKTSKIKVISIAKIFADVIKQVYNYKSISSNFII
ncbi:MAG: ribose-phosphate pyrophosphokinase [Bacteroidetes bacterium 4572_128]|nr:MAG: ribose-phosphate pyrophosphokinase [Bacteroidetes bacterium 4572_128]